MSWPTVSLGDVCGFVRGPFGGSLKKEIFKDEGYAVYEQQHAINDQFSDIRYFIDEAKFLEMKRFELTPGDLIMSCSGTMGKVAIVPHEIKNGIINQALLKISPQERMDVKFLRYWMESDDFQRQLTVNASGAAIKNVASVGVLKELKTPLPPLEEQKRIAGILDQADALRRLRTRALDKLNTLGQAIFHEMFGEGLKSQLWPQVELKDAVAVGTIVTYGIVQAGEECPGGVPYIRTGDIKNGEISTAGLRHTSPEIAAKFDRSKVCAGEIVMSIRATVGTTAIVPAQLDGANLTQGTARIAPGEKTRKTFLNYYLQSPAVQMWIQRQVKGATFREITLTRLRELPVSLPPLELQDTLNDRIEALAGETARQVIGLNEAQALFASLQHRAFRGEL